jgi:uncharacterized protein
MTLTSRFRDTITTEEQLRAVLGHPTQAILEIGQPRIDEHFRAFIAQSPFVLIASSDAKGNMDISPKGDPAGFVQVLDDRTLAIPDRPGNRRGDTFSNILQNSNVALYFMVPGVRETLRVQGRASIVRDADLRERMALNGRTPKLAIVVEVDEAFIHCAKCVIRSGIWKEEKWPDASLVPTMGQITRDQAKLDISAEDYDAEYTRAVETDLY